MTAVCERGTWPRVALLAALGVALAASLWPWWSTPAGAAAPDAAEVCLVAPPQRYDPGTGIGIYAPRPVPADARCPVCGMYPARQREWAAQAIFRNGDTHFFDSPLTLLVYLQDVAHYSRGRHADEIAATYVSDAQSGRWIALNLASFVNGSDATGPMRAGNLPAFAEVSAAHDFAKRRGGRVVSAAQITPQILDGLNGKRLHRH